MAVTCGSSSSTPYLNPLTILPAVRHECRDILLVFAESDKLTGVGVLQQSPLRDGNGLAQ